MPRIIVTTEEAKTVLLSEDVNPIHMASEHSKRQLLQRLVWAVQDAQDAETGDKPKKTNRYTDTVGA